MKLSYLFLIIATVGITSCSTQRKAQTTDDVYYSSGSNGGYVSNDGSDDRMTANAQTTDNYNNYAYGNDGYAPFSTFSAYPYMGYGMGMGYGFGYSPWASPFYSPYFAYGYYPYPLYSGYYPMYYGGYYNPYYPGFGYYSKVGITSVGGGTLPLAPGRINTMAYNNNHFNNINSTVTRVGNITRPVAGNSFAANTNKFARVATPTSNATWRPYHTTAQGTPITRSSNLRSSGSAPSYRPAGGGGFGRTGSFGGGGGGGHFGGGGGRH